jgi:hypothetical protein
MKLLPIDAVGVRSPESASLSDEEFGKHVGAMKGWFLDESGGVYEKAARLRRRSLLPGASGSWGAFFTCCANLR